MTDKEIIINGAIFNKCDGCPLYDGDICTGARLDEETSKKDTNICNEHLAEQFWVVFKQLKRKEQECEELHSRTASIIYSLTGGRLSYSTYTLKGCEDAYRDQLSIDVEKATKELEEENAKLKQECKNLEEELRGIGIKDISIESTEICKISEKSKRVLDDIEKQVKAINNDCFYDDICDCNNCDMKNGCTYYRKFNILNIINKAKETTNAR